MIELESNVVKRFSRRLTYNLVHAKHKIRPRDGHPITIKHEAAGVKFFLIYHGEQKWTMEADDWKLRSTMIQFEVSGDEQAFTRDMTMLMMLGDGDVNG
jgi:hypothetical protein